MVRIADRARSRLLIKPPPADPRRACPSSVAARRGVRRNRLLPLPGAGPYEEQRISGVDRAVPDSGPRLCSRFGACDLPVCRLHPLLGSVVLAVALSLSKRDVLLALVHPDQRPHPRDPRARLSRRRSAVRCIEHSEPDSFDAMRRGDLPAAARTVSGPRRRVCRANGQHLSCDDRGPDGVVSQLGEPLLAVPGPSVPVDPPFDGELARAVVGPSQQWPSRCRREDCRDAGHGHDGERLVRRGAWRMGCRAGDCGAGTLDRGMEMACRGCCIGRNRAAGVVPETICKPGFPPGRRSSRAEFPGAVPRLACFSGRQRARAGDGSESLDLGHRGRISRHGACRLRRNSGCANPASSRAQRGGAVFFRCHGICAAGRRHSGGSKGDERSAFAGAIVRVTGCCACCSGPRLYHCAPRA